MATRRSVPAAVQPRVEPGADHDCLFSFLSTIDGGIEQRGSEKMKRRFGLRLVNVLSLASATAMIERSQYRQRRKPRAT